MTDTASGLETVVHAPMGITSHVSWQVVLSGDMEGEVKDDARQGNVEDSRFVLVETAEVRGNTILLGFVRLTMRNSHEELARRFVSRLEEEVGAETVV